MNHHISRRNFLKKSSHVAAAAGISSCGILLKGCWSRKDFDLVIKDGLVLDGMGHEFLRTDIGISGNMIKKMGKIPHYRGKKIIESKNLVVCPGFIDVHNHTDIELIVNPKAESAVRQGVTTLISGNCGSSPFPVAEEIYEEMKGNLKEVYDVDLNWMDIRGFLARLEEKGSALNYTTLAGHGTIRGAAMGFNDRPPKQEELERMKLMVKENMQNGAFGLSTGLEYAPGSFAQPGEIIELCRIVSEFNGVYATHMRDEGDFLLESLEEAVEVARQTGVSLQISHLKIAYPRNWHKIESLIEKLNKAERENVKICCDRYPYVAGSTGLSYLFPLWARQGTTEEFLARLKDSTLERRIREHMTEQEKKLGSWDKILISSVVEEKNKRFEGKSVLSASRESGKEPFEFMRDLLIEEKNRVEMVIFMMNENNLKRILSHKLVGIGSDGSAVAPYGLLGKGKPHPRLYGTFPKVLGRYIREEKILPLTEMVKKMTWIPARKFGLTGRGSIQPEYIADIVIFDRDIVMDKATWQDPHLYPEGIYYVIVNGQIVIDKGEHTGNLPGAILRKKI
ncbi:MAG: amidohydrolase family protein [Candidatus Aminicenantes bacterium]|nr:amidohydrolase family protein [Candidatus Aminicenantes bacterium]